MANPPCKKIKLENANGIKDQNPNGSHELNNMNDDGSDAPAIENLNPVVCNICLGILQDLCEIDFVKAVSVSQPCGVLFSAFQRIQPNVTYNIVVNIAGIHIGFQ